MADGKVPLDPVLAAVAARMVGAPPPFSGTPEEARARIARSAAAARAAGPPPPEVASWEDTIARHGAVEVPVRVYRPAAPGGAPIPTAVFFHGGGFVLGGIELADGIARKLCRDAGVVVVSVGYRLAPEAPFPAAHADALAAAFWAREATASLGGDPGRLALIGESAGANLAASTALAFRDRGVPLALQVLIAPGVDMARDTTVLETAGHAFPMLTPSDLRDITRLYMGARTDEVSRCPPSPGRAASLAGAAPAVVAVAGHDPLEGEGLRFARRLADAGVRVELLHMTDMFHPFLGFFAQSAGALRAVDRICRAIVSGLPRRPGDA